MNTIIFRTVAPAITALMLVFSVFVLLRGHNEPGGGFIGGLIGASGLAVYAIGCGIEQLRKALIVHPITFAGFGVVIAAVSGLVSLPLDLPFLTGLWWIFELDGSEVALSTPMVFDIGVYAAVLGTMTTIVLALEIADEEEV